MPAAGGSRYLVTAGWNDSPHLDPQTMAELLDSTPPYLRDARSKGTPSLGSGAIYPIAESEITSPHFVIPAYWPRAFALDVGWNRTAALWCAWDLETGTGYIYAEHYRGQAEPSIHADAIKARGDWIPGVGDAAAISTKDGEQMLDIYRNLGVKLVLADKSVDAGIYDTWGMLSTGRLKVMAHLSNFFSEYRRYRRDENGKIVKANDHLMDCMRYLVRSGRAAAAQKPHDIAPLTSSGGDAMIGY